MSQDTARRSNTGIIVVLFILVAILFIWAISSARRANSIAEANEQRLSVPRLDVIYTVGGPQRFAEEFTTALEESDTAEDPLATEDLLWAALLIDNDGFADVNDVMLTVPLAEGLTPTVVAEVGGFAGIEVESTETGLSLDLGDVDEGETIYVFLGFDPAALAENVADSWATSFEATVGTISAETDGDEARFYGTAL